MGLVDTTRTDALQVPHEDGEWISVRALLATEMDEAREVRMKRFMDLWGDNLDNVGARSNPAQGEVRQKVLEVLNEAFEDIDLPKAAEEAVNTVLAKLPREDEETLAQRVQQYDALTLLKYAVVSWSYDAPVALEHIERLDAVTRDWLLEEVVQRNTRPLTSGRGSGGNSNWDGARQNSSTLTT